jgi:hypothetical protein
MEEELKNLKESLNDIDSLNISQVEKEYMRNEIQYTIMCLEFRVYENIIS